MIGLLGTVAVGAAALSLGLVRLLRPAFRRYALARPNARSSHRVPTPQGGGVAVIGAALVAAGTGVGASGLGAARDGILAAAILAVAALGGADDIRTLSARLRLAVQAGCAAVVVAFCLSRPVLPLPWPAGLEAVLLVVGLVWWTNLTNFMDGLDWITVANALPMLLALCAAAAAGSATPAVGIAAAALGGALLGFAPENRPVARLFLGDVGSLPIGLATGWMLCELAAAGGIAAAVLLPLYPAADATLTLLRRLSRGERVWEAHRGHFYQRATDHGLSVPAVIGRVLALNVALAGLAGATLIWPVLPVQLGGVSLGATLVGLTLRRFSRPA